MPKDQSQTDEKTSEFTTTFAHFAARIGTNGVATLLGTVVEQAIWYPVDTLGTKAQVEHMKAYPWLNKYYQAHGILGTHRMLYNGLVVTIPKKFLQRGYKYITQGEISAFLTANFGVQAEKHFGAYSNMVINGFAGALTGAGEVLIIQPLDRLQKEFQAKNKAFSFKESIRLISTLGLKGMYAAGWITGARNFVGSGAHFAVPVFINKITGNQDQENLLVDFSAKCGGAMSGLMLAQPFDVYKTNIQIKGLSYYQAFKMISVKQMFTSGLGPRILMSGKIATGYFGIDWLMRFFKGKSKNANSNQDYQYDDVNFTDLAIPLNALQHEDDQDDKITKNPPTYLSNYSKYSTSNKQAETAVVSEQSTPNKSCKMGG